MVNKERNVGENNNLFGCLALVDLAKAGASAWWVIIFNATLINFIKYFLLYLDVLLQIDTYNNKRHKMHIFNFLMMVN